MNIIDPHIPLISPELQEVLQQIANDVVGRFGCMGAMVTTLEAGNILVVRAYALDPSIGNLDEIPEFELVGQLPPGTFFKLNDPAHQENLAVRAVTENRDTVQTPLTSDQLYDLFAPYLPPDVTESLQQAAGVQQVIAVPFQLYHETVGSLMTAVSEPVTERDSRLLMAFGKQAATAIQNQRRLDTMQALERVILRLQACMTNEMEVLQTIVDAVVVDLGYAGAMVATLEEGNLLPVRAYAVDESMAVISQLETEAGVSLMGDQAVAYLDDAHYQENLSVRAVMGLNGRSEKYLISEHLYDLFRPVVSREMADQVQAVFGIKRVVAVPFFLGDQVLGNLFVTSRRPRFTPWELSILTALGQQAAVGINNARLYRETAKQRQIAQTFGRMAFSTIASAHSLRNYVGNVNGYVQLLQMLPQLTPERQQFILRELPMAANQLEKIIAILDNLNEPWLNRGDEPVEVHDCLARALLEVYPRTTITRDKAKVTTETNVMLHLDLAKTLAPVETVKDMLSEAFRIIIKNAEEAMSDMAGPAKMWITTRQISQTEAEISIRDNGPGIDPVHLENIFELGWSTKKRAGGMGFGLFWTKDYIDGLGGHVTATSQIGKGTTFRIVLPVVAPVQV